MRVVIGETQVLSLHLAIEVMLERRGFSVSHQAAYETRVSSFASSYCNNAEMRLSRSASWTRSDVETQVSTVAS